jgi:hypothetical protein
MWSPRPTNVIAGGLALADGSLAAIQLVAATAMIWWAWNSLRREADRTDADLAALDSLTAESMLVTERAAMWRLTGTRLHESVLNSLRYLIASPTVDREVLRDFADVSLPTPQDAALLQVSAAPLPVTRTDVSEPFNKGRLLVTAALAGNAFGGISFLIYLLTDQGREGDPCGDLRRSRQSYRAICCSATCAHSICVGDTDHRDSGDPALAVPLPGSRLPRGTDPLAHSQHRWLLCHGDRSLGHSDCWCHRPADLGHRWRADRTCACQVTAASS